MMGSKWKNSTSFNDLKLKKKLNETARENGQHSLGCPLVSLCWHKLFAQFLLITSTPVPKGSCSSILQRFYDPSQCHQPETSWGQSNLNPHISPCLHRKHLPFLRPRLRIPSLTSTAIFGSLPRSLHAFLRRTLGVEPVAHPVPLGTHHD